MNTLVINWHLTEGCNFKCKYCYAKWDIKNTDIFKSITKSTALLNELYILFENLKKRGDFDRVRLNFAGGEPLLYRKHFATIFKIAKQMGFETSIITNGSLINDSLINSIGKDIDLLGISLDSIDEETNLKIGREQGGKILSLSQLSSSLDKLKVINPNIKIKINTVVNKYNYEEDLSALIQDLSPNKWKVLKVLPSVTDSLSISDEQFDIFVDNHAQLANIMSVENNSSMQGSYLMIDPLGRFYQNRANTKGYDYSQPILDVGAVTAFKAINFDINKFKSRYQSILDIPIKVVNDYKIGAMI